MTWFQAVVAILEADTALGTLLTGGIHSNVPEISRQWSTSAFDANKEILPCLLVTAPNEAKSGPYSSSVQTTLQLFFYQRAGDDVIQAAASRAFVLLNELHLSGIWQILYASGIPLTSDDALNCPMGVQRYNVFRRMT